MSRVIIECSIFMSGDPLFYVITSSVDCNSESVCPAGCGGGSEAEGTAADVLPRTTEAPLET